MNEVAIGFWGAFLGISVLALAGAVLAFIRSARRIAVTGSLAAVLPASFALLFLGWIPVDSPDTLARLQSLAAIVCAAVLAHLLFLLLGTRLVPLARAAAAAVAIGAAGVVTALPARRALEIALGLAVAVIGAAVLASAASARRGQRSGWVMLAALPCAGVGLAGLSWHVFWPHSTPWQVHAASAVGGILFLACIAVAMWLRYSYLIEVSRIMALGPGYDAVTRLPSLQPGLRSPDLGPADEAEPWGVVVVSISNLQLLEELHGRAACNHALYVCATRLRRAASADAELYRVPEDAFALVFRRPREPQQLLDQAAAVRARLSRPVVIATEWHLRSLDAATASWSPQFGVGLLLERSREQPGVSIAGARDISRAAWTYPGRIGWFDEAARCIEPVPVEE